MRRPAREFALAVLGIALAGVLFAPRAAEEKVRLEVEVTAEDGGQPIANAAIYVKFKEERSLRRDKQREWSVKTNPEGKAVFPLLPEGKVLVQVVAKGWKTYGKFHTLRGPKYVIEIKLKRPRPWY